MEPSAWIHFADSVGANVRNAIANVLGRSGLSVAVMPPEPVGYGLILLNAVDDRILECIRVASRNAVVLVLAVEPCRVAPRELWALLHAGAVDVLLWPKVPASADQVCARLARLCTVRRITESPRVSEALVGISAAWRCLLRQVVELAVFSRGPLLITGESGTGKELIARLIHDLDRRSVKIFRDISKKNKEG